jgi:sulfoxide reductase heme-binding subunit YedZ
VIAAALAPLLRLGMGALTDGLGANPIEKVTHVTGTWTLRLLLASLSVTPARRLLGWRSLLPLRRTLGLLAFGYACLHLLTYVGLDQLFDWPLLLEDALERRYVSAGLAAFLCLVPMAATSTRAMMRRLGRRWKTLHRLGYLAALCGVVHYLWLVKADLRTPLVYAGILALLLGGRLWFYATRRSAPRVDERALPSKAG